MLDGQGAFAFTDSIATILTRAAADSTEHIYCLYGVAGPDSLLVTRAVQRTTLVSTAHDAVAERGCNLALAVWHNHPSPPDSAPIAYLYFTTTDQHTFLNFELAPMAVVGVRGGSWCAWTRLQVKVAWDLHLVPARPIPGQCYLAVP